jgi:nitrogen fixation protein NifU and related proteins
MYSAQVLDHFEHPRNAGIVENSDAQVRIENPACGDLLQLSLRISDGRIEDIRFLARGCVASVACASALTELVRGRSLAQALELRREAIVEAVGGLPAASLHASHLAVDALKKALDCFERKG